MNKQPSGSTSTKFSSVGKTKSTNQTPIMKNGSNVKMQRSSHAKSKMSSANFGYSTNSKLKQCLIVMVAAVAEEIIYQNSKKGSKKNSIRDFQGVIGNNQKPELAQFSSANYKSDQSSQQMISSNIKAMLNQPPSSRNHRMIHE